MVLGYFYIVRDAPGLDHSAVINDILHSMCRQSVIGVAFRCQAKGGMNVFHNLIIGQTTKESHQ